MGKTRRVILHPEQAMILYTELLSSTPLDRRGTMDLNAADDELGRIVGSNATTLDGRIKFQKPEDTVEAEFSFKAMRGMKTVLVQAIAGLGQTKPAASHGHRKYALMPIVEAFGKKMVEIVEKETKLNDGGDDDVDWNEKETEMDGETVDLKDNGSPDTEPEEKPKKESVSA